MTTSERKQQVAAELQAREVSLSRRLDALQSEVATTGADLKKAVVASPLVAAGGAVLAGLVLGALFGKPRRAKTRLSRSADEIAHQIRRMIGDGTSPEEAVRTAMAGHAPILIHTAAPASKKAGIFAQVLDLAFKTLVAFAVKQVVDVLLERFQLEERLAEMAAALEQTAAAAPPPPAAAPPPPPPPGVPGP